MRRDSDAFIVCEVQKPPDGEGDELFYDVFLVTLPLQIIAVGAFISTLKRTWRLFVLSLALASLVLISPWLGLIVLQSSRGPA